MLGHLDRQTAARYSAFAIAPIALGLLAAGWALQAGAVDHSARVDELVAKAPEPKPGPDAPAVGEAPAAPARPDTDAVSIAARFEAIKNRPVPLFTEPTGIEETPTPPPAEPETDIKYVGPVHLGSSMLAILRVEGRQFTASKGRTITYTANEGHHSAKVLDISETEVVLDENGAERRIARAGAGGEVVSYLGAKPGRGGKTVVMKKKADSRGAPGSNDPRANEDYQAKRARVMQEIAPVIDKMAKSNPNAARELREKAASKLKQEGFDPSVIEESLGQTKFDKPGEK